MDSPGYCIFLGICTLYSTDCTPQGIVPGQTLEPLGILTPQSIVPPKDIDSPGYCTP